jgi:glutathione S-transferase
MKLYWHPFSVFPRRVRIALREKNLAYEDIVVDLPSGALRAPEFRRLNPFGQVPVLEDGGLVISESIAILEYLEDRYPTPPLIARDIGVRATTRQLMLWSGDYLVPPWKACAAPVIYPDVAPDGESLKQGRDGIAAHLDVLEARLAGHDAWLVGDYSLADVCYAPFVTTLGLLGLNDLLAQRPATSRWIARLTDRPAVRETAPS